MNRGPAPAHWLRENLLCRMPRRHVVFDTEAHVVETAGVQVQRFRLACAAFDHQTKATRPWRPTERARFTTPQTLWAWVDERTRPGARTIVVAHNLAYDLRIADAFTVLPALGWTLDMVRLDGGSAWAQWRRDERTLCMVDTVSWFGCGLDKIGQLLRMPKLPLPAFDASDVPWFDRCASDVEILRCAWRRVLSWVESEGLGNWKPTGAGQGWAFLRHRHLTHKVLHHGIDRIAAIEREAAHTGRCEAWRWGRLPRGRWTEYDFAGAYAQVAEECDVPVRLAGHLGPKTATRAAERPFDGAALLHCTVTTEAPTVPYRWNGGILWPVGRFTSWLWDHEARQATAAGATITCDTGYRYSTAPALRSWATWVLDQLAAPPAALDPLLRLVVKGWSRTTVGRFGASWSTWDDMGEAHGPDVQLLAAGNGDTGERFRLMMVGGRCLRESAKVDAPDSAVHVMSWIMAECRVRLWRAMQCAGFENVAYVDTDGLFVNTTGARALDDAALPGLRPKSRWATVEVLGPRQLVLNDRLRAAGVPRSAVRDGPRSWRAEVWRSLPASLRNGELDSVKVTDRRFAMRGVDRRRAHTAGGATVPFEVDE